MTLSLDGSNPWRTVETAVVFDDGRLRLRRDAVIQPDGVEGSYVYLEVALPVVAVVPVDDAGNVYLVRQWRYPWGRNSWEIPTGGAEAGEFPLAAAERELGEEVGLTAAAWEDLGSGQSSATVNARWYLFLARGLTVANPGAHRRDGAEHDMITRAVPLREAIDAAMDGTIEHGMSVVGLLRAARRLGV